MKKMDTDLLDYLQGTSEVELYNDEVNYYAVELEEYAKDTAMMVKLGKIGENYRTKIVPKVISFNQQIADFNHYCYTLKEAYLHATGNTKLRESLMSQFMEKVENIRLLARELFDGNQENLVQYVEEFHDHWIGCASSLQHVILTRQKAYKYNSSKNYMTEYDAKMKLGNDLKAVATAKVEFLGENWYPKYVLDLKKA